MPNTAKERATILKRIDLARDNRRHSPMRKKTDEPDADLFRLA
jgi:hypothetical protein